MDYVVTLIPLLVPNVVIGTKNLVTHALPKLPEEKRRRKKEKEKRGSLLFFLWTSQTVHG